MPETYVRFSPTYPGDDLEQRISRLEHQMQDLADMVAEIADHLRIMDVVGTSFTHRMEWNEMVDPGDDVDPADTLGYWTASNEPLALRKAS